MAITLDGTNGIAAPNVIGLNAIINGNFGVNQRAVSGTVTLAAGAYGHDRWKAGAAGCTYTFATANNVTTITISAGSLLQVIEGANLFTGTYVLSFAGTAQGKISAGSFSATGVTGSVTGGTNLSIEFNTGTVSKVQLEAGSIATPFEQRPIGVEIALCQRYYQEQSSLGKVVGQFYSTSAARFNWNLVVPMRVAPTLSAPTIVADAIGSGSTAFGGIASSSTSTTVIRFDGTTAVPTRALYQQAVLTSFASADAEL